MKVCHPARIDALTQATLPLYKTMRRERVGNAEVARRLSTAISLRWTGCSTSRTAPDSTKWEPAFSALGKELAIEIREVGRVARRPSAIRIAPLGVFLACLDCSFVVFCETSWLDGSG
jgi:hypothetical protein